jgi:hypothetical protein
MGRASRLAGCDARLDDEPRDGANAVKESDRACLRGTQPASAGRWAAVGVVAGVLFLGAIGAATG